MAPQRHQPHAQLNPPSGMSYIDDQGGCISTFTDPVRALAPYTYIGPGHNPNSSAPNVTSEFFVSLSTVYADAASREVAYVATLSNATSVVAATAFADPLQVLWQDHDLESFPPAYAQDLARRIGVDFTPRAVSRGKPRLGASAKIEIGVGVSVGILLFFGIGFALLFTRRRRRRAETPTTAMMPELDDQSSRLRRYVGRRWRTEVEGKSGPGEMESEREAGELEGKEGVVELESLRVPGELDSKSVYVVAGPPAELDEGHRRE
jgi:hypothetical protein